MSKLMAILFAGIFSVVSLSALADHKPEHTNAKAEATEPAKATPATPATPAQPAAKTEPTKEKHSKAEEKKQHGKEKKADAKKANTADLWHCCLGHLNFQDMVSLKKHCNRN